MLVVYDERDGRIEYTVSDPVPEGMEEVLRQHGRSFITADAVDIQRDYVENDGEVGPRPECPATINVAGRGVSIADVPEGSGVVAILDPGSNFEIRSDVPVEGGKAKIEMDEAGALRIVITAPFPFLEAVHDLEIE